LGTERGGEEEMSFFKQLRYAMRMMNDMHVMREKFLFFFQGVFNIYIANIKII